VIQCLLRKGVATQGTGRGTVVTGKETGDDNANVVSIEFMLTSGESFTVRAFAEGGSLDDAVTALGERLVAEMGSERVNTFAYWEEDEYYFDAVSMRSVVAFSISPYGSDDDEDEYDEDEA